MGYRLATEAELDLADLFEIGETVFGRRQAEKYLAALLDVFALIASQARMAAERPVGGSVIRVHPFGSNVILYEIDDVGILILRVRHAHEDWLNE
jgi:toxin ParE1/3/4